MITEKHNDNVKNLSLGEKGFYNAHVKGFYVNRTFGCDSNNCLADGDFDAGTATSQRAGKDGRLPVQLEAVDAHLLNVCQ